jgi:hypothetical protein
MIPHVAGRRGQGKPRWGVALDRRHPLARGLVVCLALLERAGPTFNLVDAVSLTLGSDAAWEDELWGAALDSTGDAVPIAISSPSDYAPITTSSGDGLGDFTMAVLARPVSNATRTTMFRKRSSGSQNCGLFANCNSPINGNAQGNVAFGVRNGTSNNSLTAASQIDGGWHLWVGVRSGGNLVLYRDGVSQATASSAALDATEGSSRTLELGGAAHAQTTVFYQGEAAGAWAWNRALAADEVARFTNAPFGLLVPMPRRIAVAAVSGTTFEQALAGGAGAATAMARGIAKPLGAQAGAAAAIRRRIGKALAAVAGALAGLATLLGGQATKPARASVATAPAVAAAPADARVTRATDSDASATAAPAVDAGAG